MSNFYLHKRRFIIIDHQIFSNNEFLLYIILILVVVQGNVIYLIVMCGHDNVILYLNTRFLLVDQSVTHIVSMTYIVNFTDFTRNVGKLFMKHGQTDKTTNTQTYIRHTDKKI